MSSIEKANHESVAEQPVPYKVFADIEAAVIAKPYTVLSRSQRNVLTVLSASSLASPHHKYLLAYPTPSSDVVQLLDLSHQSHTHAICCGAGSNTRILD